MNNPNFNNYTSATTNGLNLNSTGVGVNNQLAMKPTSNNISTPGLTNMAVTDTSTVIDETKNNPQMDQELGFWSKDGNANLVLGGIKLLGNLWSSYQAHKMAKEKMSFARDQWNTNLQNQTQSYNTALEDRIKGRYANGIRSDSEVQNEIDRHSL